MEVVVAQLAERSLLIRKVRYFIYKTCLLLTDMFAVEKTKNRKKRPGIAHLLKNRACSKLL